jgi:5-methylcytosine-specific restriction endonuclease McrA
MSEQTKKFHCPRCGLGSDLKANVVAHLNNRTLCVADVLDISKEDALLMFENERKLPTVTCNHCNKIVTRKSLARHTRLCQVHQEATTKDVVNTQSIQSSNHVDVLIVLLKQKDDELTMMRKKVERLQEENKRLKEDKPPQARPKHAKGNISSTVRILCWNTHIGEEIAKTKCMCCKNLYITQHNFECGHVVARCDGGTLEINNLRPICHKCNNSMGSMNMIEFMTQHGWTL